MVWQFFHGFLWELKVFIKFKRIFLLCIKHNLISTSLWHFKPVDDGTTAAAERQSVNNNDTDNRLSLSAMYICKLEYIPSHTVTRQLLFAKAKCSW